jgi:hypothetical protein
MSYQHPTGQTSIIFPENSLSTAFEIQVEIQNDPYPLLREHDHRQLISSHSHNGNKEYNGSCAIEYLDQYLLAQKFFSSIKRCLIFRAQNLNFVNHILLPDHKPTIYGD